MPLLVSVVPSHFLNVLELAERYGSGYATDADAQMRLRDEVERSGVDGALRMLAASPVRPDRILLGTDRAIVHGGRVTYEKLRHEYDEHTRQREYLRRLYRSTPEPADEDPPGLTALFELARLDECDLAEAEEALIRRTFDASPHEAAKALAKHMIAARGYRAAASVGDTERDQIHGMTLAAIEYEEALASAAARVEESLGNHEADAMAWSIGGRDAVILNDQARASGVELTSLTPRAKHEAEGEGLGGSDAHPVDEQMSRLDIEAHQLLDTGKARDYTEAVMLVAEEMRIDD